MSDDDDVARFNRAMDANRVRPRLVHPGHGRANGQDSLPITEPAPARERRLRQTLWWEADVWDEGGIPMRAWIARPYLMRRTVTVLAGPPSGGKSSLAVAWAVALALGVPYAALRPVASSTVLLYNVEDDRDEQKRRLSAALRQFGRGPADLCDRVIRCGPENVGLLIETDPVNKGCILTEAWEALDYLIGRFGPAVVILDPTVELHSVEETDNTGMRGVLARLRLIATQHDCAVVLVHHTRKGAAAGDMEGVRGASALTGSCRTVLTAFPMSEQEAEAHDVPRAERRRYLRLDPVKANYTSLSDPVWHELVGYELDNGEIVAAAVPWTPPSLFRDLSATDCNRALNLIAAGPEPGVLYTGTRRGRGTDRWAGQVLMDKFGLPEGQATGIIRTWVRTGLLVETEYHDPQQRRMRKGMHVVDSKRPTTPRVPDNTEEEPDDDGDYNPE